MFKLKLFGTLNRKPIPTPKPSCEIGIIKVADYAHRGGNEITLKPCAVYKAGMRHDQWKEKNRQQIYKILGFEEHTALLIDESMHLYMFDFSKFELTGRV